MICFIGWHNWTCAETSMEGKYLLQFFKCSRCGHRHEYCGFIPRKWLEAGLDEEIERRIAKRKAADGEGMG